MSRDETTNLASNIVSRRVTRGFDPAALRAARGNMPVNTLSRLARTGRVTIYDWENGNASPQIDVLRRVCAALNIPIAAVVHVNPATAYPADLRVLAGLTQPELGREAALSTGAIGRIERGECELTDSALTAIAAVLRVSRTDYRAAFERVRTRPPEDHELS